MADDRCSLSRASAEGSLNSRGVALAGAGEGVVGRFGVVLETGAGAAGAAGVCAVAGAGVDGVAVDDEEDATGAVLG